MVPRVSLVSLAGVGALVAASCGGSGTADAGPSADEAASALATAMCSKAAECFGPILFTVGWESQAACVERQKRLYVANMAADGHVASPARVTGCASATASIGCGDFMALKVPTACLPDKGTRPAGAPCAFDSQCATAFCAVPSDSACGTCASPPGVGAPCVDGACAFRLFCGGDGLCRSIGTPGARCDANAPCALFSSCVGGLCVANGGPGDACDGMGVVGPRCDASRALYCDLTTKKCVAAGAAAIGDACGVQGMRYFFCESAKSFCKLSGPISGTCAPYAADGAACSSDPQVGAPCAEPARCVKGVCVFPDAAACP